MSLLKKEKEVPSTMTAVDKAKATLDEITKDVETANARARERILKFSKERDEIKKEHDALAGRIAGMTADYAKILAETQAEEAAAIAAASVVKEDLTAGRVTVSEFLKVGKRKADIEKEARAAALEKMAKVRDAVRLLGLQRYQVAAKIADLQEKISSQFSEVAGNFWHKLDSMKRQLEAQGVSASGITVAHFRNQEAQNDLSLTKGGVVFHGKQWIVKSIEDVRLLALDPIIQPEHFGELEKFAGQLEGQDFPLTVNYLPAAAQGRGPGFWFYPGPKSYHQEGAKTLPTISKTNISIPHRILSSNPPTKRPKR
jgi:hypothetical protein